MPPPFFHGTAVKDDWRMILRAVGTRKSYSRQPELLTQRNDLCKPRFDIGKRNHSVTEALQFSTADFAVFSAYFPSCVVT
jgi:hypothetical protein